MPVFAIGSICLDIFKLGISCIISSIAGVWLAYKLNGGCGAMRDLHGFFPFLYCITCLGCAGMIGPYIVLKWYFWEAIARSNRVYQKGLERERKDEIEKRLGHPID